MDKIKWQIDNNRSKKTKTKTKKRRKKCKVKELKRPSWKEQNLQWAPRLSSAQCAKSPYLSGMRSLFVGLQDAASKNGLTGTFVGYSRISLALDNRRMVVACPTPGLKNAKK
jgi:hypothetical protein